MPADSENMSIASDRLAGAVCRMVDAGLISSRSVAADALLDYATDRHRGASDPIKCVRETYAEIQSWLTGSSPKTPDETVDAVGGNEAA